MKASLKISFVVNVFLCNYSCVSCRCLSIFDEFENPSKYLHDECGIALLNSRNCVARNVRRRETKLKKTSTCQYN